MLAINALIGNLRCCVMLIKKFFSGSCTDERLSKYTKSDILFENIWICVFGFGIMIYKSARNFLLYPIAVFSPREFKEFRKFDEENWFQTEKYGMISPYVFGIFWSLLTAKYKILIRRLSKDEKRVKEDLMKLIDAEIWDKACVQRWIDAEEVETSIPDTKQKEASETPAAN
jgi:hypothetical protein